MIKVLWFSRTPSKYQGVNASGYNGGGWISSLEEEITKRNDIKLGIAFINTFYKGKEIQRGVTYYPIQYHKKSFKEKWNYFFNYSVEEEVTPYIKTFKYIIDDYKPDIIQIFGSESILGFVQTVTDIPCILHIQGILNPYKNAFFPPSISKWSYILRSINLQKIIKTYRDLKTWENSCLREENLIKNIHNFIGRTDWDEIVTKTINPNARYFYGSEILRPSFYKSTPNEFPDQMTIVSTSSGVLYKGLDLILKSAYILKFYHHCNFKWIVFGNTSNLKYIEKITRINHNDVNVIMRGIGTEKDIHNALINATAFVHPSYIDNSPNSVCEAQLVGCPVIATDVGGINSLIKEGETGFIVPANEPYKMAWQIKQIYEDKQMAKIISQKAIDIAIIRHNKVKIVDDLINVYNTLLNKKIKNI